MPLQPHLGNAYAFQPWSKYLHAYSYGKRTHLNDYFVLEPLCNCIYLFTNSGYPSLCADLSIYLVLFFLLSEQLLKHELYCIEFYQCLF